MYRYIIGYDPSGSFNEGKGTTGWCVYDTITSTFIGVGSIRASKCETVDEYWEKHLTLLDQVYETYKHDICLSIEDYILYAGTAESQINSTMETCQLLGVIKHHCWKVGMKYYIRPAVRVKARWNDTILIKKLLLTKVGKSYFIACRPDKVVCEHERDSMRHALHCAYFENGKEK